jgi:hypothetical protein
MWFPVHIHIPDAALPILPLEAALAILIWWVISDIGLPEREKGKELPYVILGYVAVSIFIGAASLHRWAQ